MTTTPSEGERAKKRPTRTCPRCGEDRIVSSFGAARVFNRDVDGDYWCSGCHRTFDADTVCIRPPDPDLETAATTTLGSTAPGDGDDGAVPDSPTAACPTPTCEGTIRPTGRATSPFACTDCRLHVGRPATVRHLEGVGWAHTYDRTPRENLAALLRELPAETSDAELVDFAARNIAGLGAEYAPQAIEAIRETEGSA